MMEFTTEELQMLVGSGYEAGYMGDVREGDMVAIPPSFRTRLGNEPPPTVKTLVVQRIFRVQSDYYDEAGGLVRNVVINFIGVDLDNLPQHCAYGSTYPCFILREQVGEKEEVAEAS